MNPQIVIPAAPAALDFKDSARLATAAALPANTRTGNTIEADVNGALPVIDGVAAAVGDRVLVKDEVAGANRGIYRVDSLGAAGSKWRMSRTFDADSSAEVSPQMLVPVEEGATLADTLWILTTNGPITLNTTALTFAQFTGIVARDGLVQAGSTVDFDPGFGLEIVGGAGSSGAARVKTSSLAGAGLGGADGAPLDVNAGSGISVAGDVVAVDATVVRTTRVITAGAGLTGGGDLSSDRTIDVVAANTSIVVAANDIKAAVPKNADKARAPAAVAVDNGSTTLAISNTPAAGSYVTIMMNGIRYELGDGVKTKHCYFSADAGVTARAIASIVATDVLFWNAVISGVALAVTDSVDMDYEVA